MAQRNIKTEYQALRLAQKTNDEVFTHVFGGVGYLEFNSNDLAHPKLYLNFYRAGALIYETIKTKPVEFYYKSYATKYGKGVVPKELITYAYYQAEFEEGNGRLVITLDFSKDSLMRKYLGKPEVRVIDDLIFEDSHLSTLQCAFFHLFNTRLKDERWALFRVDLQYKKDGEKITFEEFNQLLKEVEVL